MIPHPPGWEVVAFGDAELLFPPEGVEAGLIRYLERLAPVRPVRELLAGQLADDPDFEVSRIEPMRELVTFEGEHAALVRVRGRLGGAPCQRDIGYVFTDEHYARVGGVAHRPDLFDRWSGVVEHLVANCSQMLGLRQRRYRYLEPGGWSRVDRGLRAEWMCPGFPDDPGQITVWPALPLALGGATFARGLGAASEGPYPVISAHRLGGDRWRRRFQLDDGRSVTRDLVVLRDDRYVYPARIDRADPAHDEAFEAILASIQPIPRARGEAARARRPDALDFWIA